MKNLLYILPFLLLPIFVVAQENITEVPVKKGNTNFKNQIDSDWQVLSYTFGYKRRVSKSLFLGANVGFGPALSFAYITNKHSDNYYSFILGELMHFGIVAKKNSKISKFSFEAESRIGLIGYDEASSLYTFGFLASIYYGEKIQIGFRIAFGKFYNVGSDDLFLSTNLITLRINTKW